MDLYKSQVKHSKSSHFLVEDYNEYLYISPYITINLYIREPTPGSIAQACAHI